ncbi:MAG: HAD domain-containing protein [Bdellovibrionales bacterium]
MSGATKEEPPVIFLDIDGVLRTDDSGALMAIQDFENLQPGLVGNPTVYDPTAMAYLNHICRITGARVVICSAKRNERNLRHELVRAGFQGSFHRNWRTPLTERGSTRSGEISAWLQKHPRVKNYVILDDDSLGADDHKNRWVQTPTTLGLGYLETMLALQILGVEQILKPLHIANKYDHISKQLQRLAKRLRGLG